MDIRKEPFTGIYDNIIWDGAIEHFTLDEMDHILRKAHKQLKPQGILSGYTIIGNEHGPSHDDHEYEFKSKLELKKLLEKHFKHVLVFDTKYPDRHNLYFFGSDIALSFLKDFQDTVSQKSSGKIEILKAHDKDIPLSRDVDTIPAGYL